MYRYLRHFFPVVILLGGSTLSEGCNRLADEPAKPHPYPSAISMSRGAKTELQKNLREALKIDVFMAREYGDNEFEYILFTLNRTDDFAELAQALNDVPEAIANDTPLAELFTKHKTTIIIFGQYVPRRCDIYWGQKLWFYELREFELDLTGSRFHELLDGFANDAVAKDSAIRRIE